MTRRSMIQTATVAGTGRAHFSGTKGGRTRSAVGCACRGTIRQGTDHSIPSEPWSTGAAPSLRKAPLGAKPKALRSIWVRFADRWRDGYAPAMNKVRKGELPWTRLDDLHRILLNDLLKEFGMTGLSEEEKDHWNRVWHRLQPWPDSVAGLTRLKKKYTIAPLSNGNVAPLTDMPKNAGLPRACPGI